MERYAVGMDLGGTFLKGGIVSERGEIFDMQSTPSEVKHGPERILENLLSMADQLIEKARSMGVQAAGLAVVSPGVIDPVFGGIAGGAENLPGWKNIPFMRILEERFGITVSAHNDVTSHVLGEARFGAGKGKRNIVMASFGTGIGGGIVVDGKLYSGAIGYAGEIGHMAVHAGGHTCACGIRGCWEEYASTRGILRIARSVLEKSAGKEPEGITPEMIFDAAREGEGAALEIVDEIGRETAIGIGGLINIFNPEIFIIGGGIASAGRIYFDAIRKHLPDWTLTFSLRSVEIAAARLGYESGIIGAAVLVFDGINTYKGGSSP